MQRRQCQRAGEPLLLSDSRLLEICVWILTIPSSKPPCQSLLGSRASVASRDQLPPPTEMRKTKQQNMAKSVRASLTMYQKPWLARNNSGIFVVAIAVVITISSGMDTILVHSPTTSRRPHRTSKVPTKCAVKYGC